MNNSEIDNLLKIDCNTVDQNKCIETDKDNAPAIMYDKNIHYRYSMKFYLFKFFPHIFL